MKKKLLILLCVVVALSFGLYACGGGANDTADEGTATEESAGEEAASDDGAAADEDAATDATGGKLAAIQSSGKLVMYTNAEFPPYETIGEGGEIVGVDVEIGKAIAEKLGVELEIENAQFDGIVASIASGKGDVAITGLTITEERSQQIDFSVPYVDSIQYLIVPDDTKIATVEDLADLRVGAQTGTTGEMLLGDDISGGVLAGTSTEVVQYNSAPLAMEDLKNGRIDAVIIDEQVAIQLAGLNDGYQAIPANYTSGDPMTEQYGVGIAKGNEDLLAVINEVVTGLVAEDKITAWLDEYSVEE
jgi:polar amino acid transport system substrate-binding protein